MMCSSAMVVGSAGAHWAMARGRDRAWEDRAMVEELTAVLLVLSDGPGKVGARRIETGDRRLWTTLPTLINSARQSSGQNC